MAPARAEADIRFLGVRGLEGVVQAMRMVERVAQKVLPRVNHCNPEANAKSAGVLDLITPAKAPIVRPVAPVEMLETCRTIT